MPLDTLHPSKVIGYQPAGDYQPAGSYQPADPDLAAIAALETKPFGRSLLTGTDKAAILSQIGLDRVVGAVNSTTTEDWNNLVTPGFHPQIMRGNQTNGLATLTITLLRSRPIRLLKSLKSDGLIRSPVLVRLAARS